MPATIQVASHTARRWNQPKVTSDGQLLKASCEQEAKTLKSMTQSSLSPPTLQEKHISSSTNGFVYTCFEAYSSHHHLTIRPEDVWLAILSQTSFYVNAHAEELRHLFVKHEGQKELEVVAVGTRHSVDFGDLARRMTQEIEKNVVDPELREWMLPAFTTTTDSDVVVASILMMGTMQKYFSYGMCLMCGIPSVTLLGERKDWEEIERRIPKLERFGSESAQFASLLKPILRGFLDSFDNPGSPAVKDFWSKIAHETGGSGPYLLSGWITAFCFWDVDGKCMFSGKAQPPPTLEDFQTRRAGCELNGTLYHRVDTLDIPPGFTSVPVVVNDNGDKFKAKMVAGSIGTLAKDSVGLVGGTREQDDAHGNSNLDSVQPLTGWFMFEVSDAVREGVARA